MSSILKKEKSIIRLFLGTATLKLLGRGLSVLLGIFIARLLGPENFGRYAYIMSIITVAGLPAIAGLPQLIVRQVARYCEDERYDSLFGINTWSTFYVLIVSFISIILLILLIGFNVWERSIVEILLLSLVLIPARGLLSRQGAVLNGLHRPELAQLPSLVLVPLFTLTCLAIYSYYGSELRTGEVVLIQGICASISLVFSFFLLQQILNKYRGRFGELNFKILDWQRALLPFTILAIVSTMSNEIATLSLGFLSTEEQVGFFRVAVQGITLLGLGLQAVNTISGPRIAALFNKGEINAVQSLLRHSVRLSFFSSFPLALLLIVFGESLVGLLFGSSFIPAATLLTILCIGQIVNIGMGSVGLVLNMTGHEKTTLRTQIATLCITVLLLFILVPIYHAVGAAIAISSSLIIWNITMAFQAYKLTGLRTWLH